MQTEKVKTICTIGPASLPEPVLEQLVITGMDIARLNFSHASFEQFDYVKETLARLNTMYDKHVEIMMDLQGPRMRVGLMPEEGLELTDGQEVVFTTDSKNTKDILITDPYLHQDIKPNHPLYLANGDIALEVTKTEHHEIFAKVTHGGILHSRKGVNVPETDLTTGSITDKDIADAEYGAANGADYLALSFVKSGADLDQLRGIIKNDKVKLVSKVERKQAILNINSIIDRSDVIMVARGDLGIELPLETLPILQKDIMKRCVAVGKPAIVATQMLMSMVNNPRPTRAEVSDVANAVFDGAWAVMLSDETAFGEYPINALDYLVKTAAEAKNYLISQHALAQ